MKITYFINQYPKVSHTFVRREILALEGLGMDIQRIALRGWNEVLPDPVDQKERDKTRYVLRHGALSLFLPTLSFALRAPIRLMRAFRLAIRMSFDTDRRILHHLVCVMEGCVALRWVRQHASTHVHAHFGTNSAEVAVHMRILGGPPFSFTAHGPREFIAPLALDEKLRHAKFAVAISSFGRSQLYMRSAHADWDKIHVVRCGIERQFYENAPVPQNTSQTFLCIGRLSEAKGQMLLLAAVARLIARGVNLYLTIAGDGPMRSALEEFIVRHELGNRVRITGWISSAQVRAEIIGCRALILPSFAEGLPVVLMEAMSLRKPVLATYVAGIPELVQHNVSGWLFPAGSSSELEAALEDCLSRSEQSLGSMGREGFARVLLHHSVETEVVKLAALIQGQ
jgi:colanic acid/amylovoran biosynthesis glycosyltransferase